jgi:hypothetical protein
MGDEMKTVTLTFEVPDDAEITEPDRLLLKEMLRDALIERSQRLRFTPHKFRLIQAIREGM